MKLSKQFFYKNWVQVLFLIAVFFVFYYINSATPLAGDDWGYAISGSTENPFLAAYNSYFTWSGRYFSELWGFLIAPRKELWNVLNPMLFTIIMGCGYYFIKPENNRNIVVLVLFGLLFSVNWELRKETYSWVMGSTYVAPLTLMFIYLVFLEKPLLENKSFSSIKLIILSVISFVGCLFMENMTAIWLLANILILLYSYFFQKGMLKKTLVLLLVSLIALIIIRCSPGATARMLRDSSDWMSLSLFGKMSVNWNNFLIYTFINNKYILRTFALIGLLSAFTIYKRNKKISWDIILILIMNMGMLIFSFAEVLYQKTGVQFLRLFYCVNEEPLSQIICSVFFISYIGIVFLEIWILILDREKKLKAMFILFLAGTGNLVMLISPIFGPRSSLYTVIFLIMLIGILVDNCIMGKIMKCVVAGIYFIISYSYINQYYVQYRSIAIAQADRLGQIQYYNDRPERTDIWITYFPKDIVHSSEFLKDDEFHLRVFKEYYKLNPDATITFYYEKSK